MDVDAVPQEGNAALAGQRKVVYARDAAGRMVGVASRGWEAEEIVTGQAIDALQALARQARERVLAGHASVLEFWMHERRMDVALLAQTSGFWRWRVRRHLRPAVFARLPQHHKQRYAEALGLTVATLEQLP